MNEGQIYFVCILNTLKDVYLPNKGVYSYWKLKNGDENLLCSEKDVYFPNARECWGNGSGNSGPDPDCFLGKVGPGLLFWLGGRGFGKIGPGLLFWPGGRGFGKVGPGLLFWPGGRGFGNIGPGLLFWPGGRGFGKIGPGLLFWPGGRGFGKIGPGLLFWPGGGGVGKRGPGGGFGKIGPGLMLWLDINGFLETDPGNGKGNWGPVLRICLWSGRWSPLFSPWEETTLAPWTSDINMLESGSIFTHNMTLLDHRSEDWITRRTLGG